MTTLELFPETSTSGNTTLLHVEWVGVAQDKYGHPRATVKLLPKWSAEIGWQVGWLVRVDKSLDEWHPNSPNRHLQHGSWPWYRLEELPNSRSYAIAAAMAGRAAKIVLAQMFTFVDPDIHVEVLAIQEQMERQAMAWLQE